MLSNMFAGKNFLLRRIFHPVFAKQLIEKADSAPTTETVVFDMKRFLEEPDGMTFGPDGPVYGLWYASDKYPEPFVELGRSLATIDVNGQKQYARQNGGSIMGYGYCVHLLDESTGRHVASILAAKEKCDDVVLGELHYGYTFTVPQKGLYVLFSLNEADRAVYAYLDVCTCTLTWEKA